MIQRKLKVFEGGDPQDIEKQVHSFGEKNRMVPFSISVVKSQEGRKSKKYKAFVIFEDPDRSSHGFGKELN